MCGTCFLTISSTLGKFDCDVPLFLKSGHSLYIFPLYVVFCFEVSPGMNLFRFSWIISSFFFLRKLTANSSRFFRGSECSTIARREWVTTRWRMWAYFA